MPFIVWTNRMRVDVKLLDNDHKKQVLLVNELHEGLVTGRAKLALERIFEELVRHTRIHIAHEEQIFAETAYPNAAVHIQEHDRMIERAEYLYARFKSGSRLSGYLVVINQLEDWLFSHIQGADQRYIAHLKAKGIDSILAAWNVPTGVALQRMAFEVRAGSAGLAFEAWNGAS
ncbi:MAG: bacteriohemerythrin [Terracidiphilus sp.]|jgi:hemerythrin-like metal-binding protein